LPEAIGGFLNDSVAIVTGGTSGIGRAISLRLASERCHVVAVGRDEIRLQRTQEELDSAAPGRHLALPLDVRDPLDMQRMAQATINRFGRIDILVCCAGIAKTSSTRLIPFNVATLPVDEWEAILATNLKGVFLANKAVLPAMVEQQSGFILNVSSSPGGLSGQPFASAYCASKFGIIGFTQSLSEEVAEHGVITQVLVPDAIDTPLLDGSTLARRLGTPIPASRVADVALTMIHLGQADTLVAGVIVPSRLRDHQELRPYGI